MTRWQKDRLIGAIRLEYGGANSGLVAVRRRGDLVVLSGFWPGGVMSKHEAARLAQLLSEAAGSPIPVKAVVLAGSWVSPPVLERAVR